MPPDQRKLGMVFQSYAIWPHMTVFDNVAYPLSRAARRQGRDQDQGDDGAALVEMERYADRPAPALSGGQQQRVAIARALVFEPEVLLLDEPLSNLDARLRAQMGDEFRALQRRLKITTLYVTHDQEEAMALSDRVVVMHKGRILQVGAPETVYRRPASRDGRGLLRHAQPDRGRRSRPAGRRPTATIVLTIEGAGGTRRLPRRRRRIRPGDAVLVVVRPEDVALAANGTAATDSSPGRARWSTACSAGRAARSTVEASGRRFNVECPATRAAAVGETVTPAGRRRQCLGAEPDRLES